MVALSSDVVVVLEPSWVDEWGVWVAIAAAVIAAASAAIIAWQAFQTRAAVVLAGEEFKRGEALRVDAFKARVDAEMPRITVTAEPPAGLADDPDTPTVVFVGGGEERDRERYDEDTVFVMPRDAAVELRVRVFLAITNDGPRRMRATIAMPRARRSTPSWTTPRPKTIDVLPGAPRAQTLTVERVETLERWVEISRGLRGEVSGVGLEEVIFQLSYVFPSWEGAVENHEVLMGGTVVEPVPGNAGGWRLVKLAEPSPIDGSMPVSVVVQPFERLYFRNKRGDDAMGWID